MKDNKKREIIAHVKAKNLFSYLCTRAALRFLPISYLSKKDSISFSNTSTIKLDLNDLEQKYLLLDCVREPENLIIYRCISKATLADTFIDIGANCGHVSLSVISDYKKIILFEPNPKLIKLLKSIFKGNSRVILKSCAIVDRDNIGYLELNVPKNSSGLATLGDFLVDESEDFITHTVRSSTLEKEVSSENLKNAFIKIDVEGLEEKIIGSIHPIINRYKPIIGFEALSSLKALKCIRQFKGYSFYCARFNFLENGGALSRSALGIFKGLFFGSSIDFIKINNFNRLEFDNFSQIYAVPNSKAVKFEIAIKNYFNNLGTCDLSKLKAWKF